MALAGPRAIAQNGMSRIGYLATRSRPTAAKPDPYYAAFTQGMKELGYVEGRNLHIEWRYADGDYSRFAGLADELVAAKVEVIATNSLPSALALQKATRSVPIVFMSVTDPLASGLVQNLAKPGGNLTGTSNMTADLSAKRIEILRGVIRNLFRLGVLLNPHNPAHQNVGKAIQSAASRFGIQVQPMTASTAAELDRAFEGIVGEGSQAVIVANDAFFLGQREQIAALAIRNRVALMSSFLEEAEAGSLASYGPNNREIYRRAATYVDKILKGQSPGKLPVEQPTHIELVLNQRTAKALRVAIPNGLLQRADRVIQ